MEGPRAIAAFRQIAGGTDPVEKAAPGTIRGDLALITQDNLVVAIDTVLADAGYDAEHNHRLCREDLGVRRTVIRLNRRNTGRRWPKAPYRRAMPAHTPPMTLLRVSRRSR